MKKIDEVELTCAHSNLPHKLHSGGDELKRLLPDLKVEPGWVTRLDPGSLVRVVPLEAKGTGENKATKDDGGKSSCGESVREN